MKGGIVISTEAHTLIQRTRRAFVEAGPGQWCQEAMQTDSGAQRCVMGRMLRVALDSGRYQGIDGISRAQDVYNEVRYFSGIGNELIHTNDVEGYEAVVAHLDHLIDQYRPPRVPLSPVVTRYRSDRRVEVTAA